MTKTGQLKVDSGVLRLNGTRLARVGDGKPFEAATNFLAALGHGPDDFIRVDGSDGFVGSVPV